MARCRRFPPAGIRQGLFRRAEPGSVCRRRRGHRPGLYRRCAPHRGVEGKPDMSVRARLGRIGRALVSSAALLTIATVVLALLVWFIGPLLSVAGGQPLAPLSVRLAILLVLALVWGIAGLFMRVRRSSEDQALLAALRRQREEQQHAAAQ